MSVAWTTLSIIALLMPGVAFFIGYWARERHSREIVRSNAVGEVGMALLVAATIYLVAWWALWLFAGFDLSLYLRPLTEYENIENRELLDRFVVRLWPALWYLVLSSVAGFALGYAVAWMVMFGWLRFLATHAWAYDLIKEVKRRGTVTAYVLTNTAENNRVLMYAGHLEEFYLDANGWFSYVVLKDCYRFYMILEGNRPVTGEHQTLFKVRDSNARKWEHLAIDGRNIANILFDPSIGEIEETPTGTKALEDALREYFARSRSRPSGH